MKAIAAATALWFKSSRPDSCQPNVPLLRLRNESVIRKMDARQKLDRFKRSSLRKLFMKAIAAATRRRFNSLAPIPASRMFYCYACGTRALSEKGTRARNSTV